ncbi:MAG: LysM peptidoglycan-binding domain-containing protein [Planctomycetes bacterium]|nr:LysM peptidoglycan-binding domain-containing protein [Planctomycetota bacterium]
MIRMAFGLGALCLLLALGVVLYRFGAELAREAAQELQVNKDGDETAPPAAPVPEAAESAAPTAPAPETAAPATETAAAPSAPVTPIVPEAAPVTPVAPESPAQPTRTHKVASGDSLWKLSVQYYGSATHVAELMQANQLTAATLRPGQVLVIPEIAGTKAAEVTGNADDAPANADHEVAQGTASNERANEVTHETDQAATPSAATAPAASGSADSPFVPMPPSL